MFHSLLSLLNFVGKKIDIVLESNTDLRKIAKNILWLFFDKIFSKGLNFLLIVLIAQEIGADDFGKWNYLISFFSFFALLSSLGLSSVVIKKLVEGSDSSNTILGTAFTLKFLGALLTLLLGMITLSLLKNQDEVTLLLGIIIAISYLFRTFEVIDFFFQSKTLSKYVVLARSYAIGIAAVVNVYFLYNHFTVEYFVLTSSIEFFLFSFFLIFFFSRREKSVFEWRFSRIKAIELLKEGFPLVLAETALIMYMRIDQIMIGEIYSDYEVGIYSSAIKISEMIQFIPFIVTRSFFPNILEIRITDIILYHKRLQILLEGLLLFGLLIAIMISFSNEIVITSIYGVAYSGASGVLAFHIWATMFSFTGYVVSSWYIAEGKNSFLFYRMLAGALVNICLNAFLIPAMGIIGAALATLLSQFVSNYIFNCFHKETRFIFFMQSRAFINIFKFRFLKRTQ